MSAQAQPFASAMKALCESFPPGELHYEIMTLKIVRETSSMTLKCLVDWLAGSHIHFIICHPHDGTTKFLWTIEEIYIELDRLRHHMGFPMNRQLHCPIFRQDKFRYLELLPQDCIMPTLRIPISSNMNREVLHEMIQR